MFTADEAAVLVKRKAVEATFQLQLHAIPPQRDHLEVQIVIDGGHIQSRASGADVAITYRDDLAIPGR